jgi:hypothetical protein
MAMIGLRLSLWLNSTTGGIVSPSIQLSANSVAENASVGTDIGTLSVVNGSGTYTFTISLDPDSKFAVTGANGETLETGAALDYETATSHSVTIEADNGVDTPIEREFTINVTDVVEGGGSFLYDFSDANNSFYLPTMG